ncbi:alpha/beta hydrolase, partial [bacterium]|nr:alpha/beta hydrolase [bacterium]
MESRTIDLDGPIHYADFGGEGPTLVLVHGLGGSHVNWISSAPLLAKHARVLAPDLPGFGRTPRNGRSAAVLAQARILDRFLESTGRAILVGNSMGGLVVMLEAARRPESVAGLVLVDPAQPRPRSGRVDPAVAAMFALYSVPWVGEVLVRRHVARVGAQRLVENMLALCCADRKRIAREVIDAHVAVAREGLDGPGWSAAFIEAAQSILRLVLEPSRYRQMVARIEAPTLLLHGKHDRLVPLASSERLARSRPDWTFHALDGIGHVPMLEDPPRFTELVRDWLGGAGNEAASVAAAEG